MGKKKLDLDLDHVIEQFKLHYEAALVNGYVHKPLSWALYQTWKWCDAKEKDRTLK